MALEERNLFQGAFFPAFQMAEIKMQVLTVGESAAVFSCFSSPGHSYLLSAYLIHLCILSEWGPKALSSSPPVYPPHSHPVG